MEKNIEAIKQDFHSLNNWLSKIASSSGLARYNLEKKGLDLEKIEEEKENLIEVLRGLEQNALKMGEVLKNLRKALYE